MGQRIEFTAYRHTLATCTVNGKELCAQKCNNSDECKEIYYRVESLGVRDFSVGLLAFSLVCFTISIFKERKLSMAIDSSSASMIKALASHLYGSASNTFSITIKSRHIYLLSDRVTR